jgi:hypothetical protein
MTLKSIAALAATLFACTSAFAENETKRSEVWLATGFATYHFESEKNLNSRNPGIGVEYKFSDTSSLAAGRFYNSDRKHSRYAGMIYQPLSWGGAKFGAMAGAFDGYPKMHGGEWFVALVPAATFEYRRVGINVVVVPSYKDKLHGGISMQLKFKLWD